MKTLRFVPLSALLLTACADGGEEDRPQSEVQIEAPHHLFTFRTLRGLGTTLPIDPAGVFGDSGTLNLSSESSYNVLWDGSATASGNDRYALEKDGALAMYVTGYGNEPTVLFQGGYLLSSFGVAAGTSQNDFFFTDRVSTNNSPSIGLYYGTRQTTTPIEFEGDWHLLSLHSIFAQTAVTVDSVGRGAFGTVTVPAGAMVDDARTLSGSGTQNATSPSNATALTFDGSLQYLSTPGDGSCNLTLGYRMTGLSSDQRVMRAAANENIIYGLDEDESDGEAGIAVMVRQFSTSAADIVRVAGTYLIGGHTLFVAPNNSGADTFVGTLTLTQAGAFNLTAVGNTGQDFAYTGTFTLAADGSLEISINGTNEVWRAAIDQSYDTLFFVDDFVEFRALGSPELNFGMGLRQREAP